VPGRCGIPGWCRPKTSKVAAMANTPSLKPLARLVVIRVQPPSPGLVAAGQADVPWCCTA
jgi:hypothetical protein